MSNVFIGICILIYGKLYTPATSVNALTERRVMSLSVLAFKRGLDEIFRKEFLRIFDSRYGYVYVCGTGLFIFHLNLINVTKSCNCRL